MYLKHWINKRSFMKNLVINAGSSSLKFQVFDNDESILSGMIEEIGTERAKLKFKFNGEKKEEVLKIENHKQAFLKVLDLLKEKNLSDEIEFISHRIVHGGEKFNSTILVTDEILEELDKLN